MAKKEAFTFDSLAKEFSKFGGNIMKKSNISAINEYIHSGNYILNAALMGDIYKGYPDNRSVALIGPSGVGKTYLLLNAAREAQKMGYKIIWYDSENAVDGELMERFGINTDEVIYNLCGTIEEFITSITNLTELIINKKEEGVETPKIIIILDSAGNLASKKEVDDAISGSEKADMTRAKKFKSLFRIITYRLAMARIPFLFSNHIYMTQDFISQIKMGGGTGPEYAASIILNISKSKLNETLDGEKKQTGIILNINSFKNRFAKPEKIKILLHFDRGINPYIGLEKYLKWDICGIERGNLVDLNKVKNIEYDSNRIINNKVFVPNENSRYYVVKHLSAEIKINEIYNSDVFNKDVLDAINVYVKKDFMLGLDDGSDIENIESLYES